MKNLNKMAQRIHQLNIKWWQDPITGERIQRNKGELIALIHSEISEAYEGIKNDLIDDHLTHRKMEEVEMADGVIRAFDYAGGFGYNLEFDFHSRAAKGSKENCISQLHLILSSMLEVERKGKPGADIILSEFIYNVELYCETFGLDLKGAIEEKLAYNAQRSDHKPENRIKDGGKKF
jgi:hypothetical protein